MGWNGMGWDGMGLDCIGCSRKWDGSEQTLVGLALAVVSRANGSVSDPDSRPPVLSGDQ